MNNMTNNIKFYAARCSVYAERISQDLKNGEEGDDRARAQMMADCVELHEITNRLYAMLYNFKPELPGHVDPFTLRHREYDDETPKEN